MRALSSTVIVALAALAAGCGYGRLRADHILRTMGEPLEAADATCADGEGYACEAAAQLHLGGGAGARSVVAARAALRTGCDAGDARSCEQWRLVSMHQRGMARLVAACLDRTDPAACAETGAGYLFGDWVDPHPEVAVQVLATGCSAPPPPARLGGSDAEEAARRASCRLLGLARLTGVGGVTRAPELGLSLLVAGCEIGDAAACAFVGYAYEHGLGVPADEARAEALYAAQTGDAFALFQRLERADRDDPAWPVTRRLDGYTTICFDDDPTLPPVARIACLRAAQLRLSSGRRGAYGLASLSCRKGWRPGCQLLGTMHDLGDELLGIDLR